MKRPADIETVVASPLMNENGFMLTYEALQQMVDDAEGKPLWDSFETKNVIGEIVSASIDEHGWATMEFTVFADALKGKYIVPKIALGEDDYERNGSGMVIHNIGWLCGCALTNNPADRNLIPIGGEDEATG